MILLAARAPAPGGGPPGGADRLAVAIQAIDYGAWLWSTTLDKQVGAVNAALISTLRQLRAAVITKTNIAFVCCILAFDNDNARAARRPTRPAGTCRRCTCRGSPWLMPARCEDEGRCREDNQAAQKRSHRCHASSRSAAERRGFGRCRGPARIAAHRLTGARDVRRRSGLTPERLVWEANVQA